MANVMEVILLERVDNLGSIGQVVRVRPGYARNFLLPQQKALRATKDNIAYFEAQRAVIEKKNAETKAEAEKLAKKLQGLTVTLVRLASESGQLFGSVNARDIADVITAQSGLEVTRTQVPVNQSIKLLGLFPVTVVLHPEVRVPVTVNIARSEEEAKIQAETGRALTAGAAREAQEAIAEDAKSALLEDSALEAEKQASEEDAEKEAEKQAKAAKKASKKAAKASDEAEDAEEDAAE